MRWPQDTELSEAEAAALARPPSDPDDDFMLNRSLHHSFEFMDDEGPVE